MEERKRRHTNVKDPLVRVQVVLTRRQLDMLNDVSQVFHRNRSQVIREGVGDVLDRYYRIIEEQKK